MPTEIQEPFGWANGKIIASENGWKIEFYIAGPDGRYNGEWVRVSGSSAARAIDEYRQAFAKFAELSALMPEDVEVAHKVGWLTVRLGPWRKGVCMGYSNPVASESHLRMVVSCFERACVRGPKLAAAAEALAQDV